MTTGNETINNLVAIVNSNGVYSALYRWQETVVNNYAHPVYTNVPSMTGKANTSRTLRNMKQASKVVNRESSIELCKDEAQALYEAAKATNMIARTERQNINNWVVWVS